MSAETLDYHHGKHHKAYVDKTNALCRARTGLAGALARRGDPRGQGERRQGPVQQCGPASGTTASSGNAWRRREGQQPTGKLAELIDEGFGDLDALLAKLKEEAVGHFANGWAWLVLDGDALKITSLHDADTPVAHDGMKPLLTLDVWEHAYYIDYRNERPKFAESVLGNIVNWEFVAKNLDGDGVSPRRSGGLTGRRSYFIVALSVTRRCPRSAKK